MDVAVASGYAYIADGGGLRIIDVTDPTHPSEASFYQISGNTQSVALSGHFAYVATGNSGGIRMIDVSNPASPIEVGSYDTLGYAESVAGAGDYAYVADGSGGLVTLRFRNKAQFLPLTLRY